MRAARTAPNMFNPILILASCIDYLGEALIVALYIELVP
jgi:hypothetical protein